MKNLVIGISGINAIDNPGPGVAVARSLKEDTDLNVTTIGLAYDAMEPGIYLDWVVDRSYLMPYPSVGGEAVVDRLLEIKARHGLDLVIPNLDSELPIYIRYAEELKSHGIAVMVPTMQQFRLRSKDQLMAAAPSFGCEAPATVVLTGPGQLDAALATLGLPLMIKGCLYEAYRADTAAAAHYYANKLAEEWGWPVLVQRIVTGEHLNVVGLGDGTGGHLGLVGLKKLSMTKLGKIQTGVTVTHPGMLAAAERFIRESRWRGPFELECIVDGDHIHLIEINPRFPAWCYLATGVGLNLPARLVRHQLGLPIIGGTDYPAGRLFIRYSYEVVADMSHFQSLVTTGADQ
jgi:carbamoyl-phosphate synthase large subunit